MKKNGSHDPFFFASIFTIALGIKKAGLRPAFLKSNKNYLEAAADAAAGAASAAGADAGAAAGIEAAASAGADAGAAAGADAGVASTEADAEAGASAGLLHATKATANKETSKSDFFMFLLSINRSKKTTYLR